MTDAVLLPSVTMSGMLPGASPGGSPIWARNPIMNRASMRLRMSLLELGSALAGTAKGSESWAFFLSWA